jgi:hypothetical protein
MVKNVRERRGSVSGLGAHTVFRLVSEERTVPSRTNLCKLLLTTSTVPALLRWLAGVGMCESCHVPNQKHHQPPHFVLCTINSKLMPSRTLLILLFGVVHARQNAHGPCSAITDRTDCCGSFDNGYFPFLLANTLFTTGHFSVQPSHPPPPPPPPRTHYHITLFSCAHFPSASSSSRSPTPPQRLDVVTAPFCVPGAFADGTVCKAEYDVVEQEACALVGYCSDHVEVASSACV